MKYSKQRNNWKDNPKNSTVYTPKEVSNYIYTLLKRKVKDGLILDIGSGLGSLHNP